MNDLLVDANKQIAGFFEADSSKVEQVGNNEVAAIADLCKRANDKKDLITKMEEELKQLKKELLKLTDEDIPDTMTEIGVSEYKLIDGSSVTLKPTYGAHISEDNQQEAFQWLRDNECDDIIKNTVSVEFGRKEDELALAFKELVEEHSYEPMQVTKIHPQTLKAFIKERIEKGMEIPNHLFGVWAGQRAIIKKGDK